jgi:hypothetical protein
MEKPARARDEANRQAGERPVGRGAGPLIDGRAREVEHGDHPGGFAIPAGGQELVAVLQGTRARRARVTRDTGRGAPGQRGHPVALGRLGDAKGVGWGCSVEDLVARRRPCPARGPDGSDPVALLVAAFPAQQLCITKRVRAALRVRDDVVEFQVAVVPALDATAAVPRITSPPSPAPRQRRPSAPASASLPRRDRLASVSRPGPPSPSGPPSGSGAPGAPGPPGAS